MRVDARRTLRDESALKKRLRVEDGVEVIRGDTGEHLKERPDGQGGRADVGDVQRGRADRVKVVQHDAREDGRGVV